MKLHTVLPSAITPRVWIVYTRRAERIVVTDRAKDPSLH